MTPSEFAAARRANLVADLCEDLRAGRDWKARLDREVRGAYYFRSAVLGSEMSLLCARLARTLESANPAEAAADTLAPAA